MTPSWPPIEVSVSCGLAPSVAHLRRTVCGALGGLSADRAVLYKYSLQTCSWSELKPGLRVEGTGAAGRPVGLVKRIENVLDPPYSMKEGDLLCAFEVPSQDVMAAALAKHLNDVEVQISTSTATASSASISEHVGDVVSFGSSLAENVPASLPANTQSSSSSSATPTSAPTSALAARLAAGAAAATPELAAALVAAAAATPTPALIAAAAAPTPALAAGLAAAAASASSIASGKSSTTLLAPAPTVIVTAVSRPEDQYLQLMRHQDKIDKKSGIVGGFRHMKNRKEIILSLGGDLNFSDDDSGDD